MSVVGADRSFQPEPWERKGVDRPPAHPILHRQRTKKKKDKKKKDKKDKKKKKEKKKKDKKEKKEKKDTPALLKELFIIFPINKVRIDMGNLYKVVPHN